MEYSLRLRATNKVKYILLAVLMAAAAVAGVVFMFWPDNDFTTVILSLLIVAIGIYGFFSSVRALTDRLDFDSESFTHRRKTYSYDQIDNVMIIGNRWGSIYYNIYVYGKRVYVFEGTFYGADEFLKLLYKHEVPIEHYSLIK